MPVAKIKNVESMIQNLFIAITHLERKGSDSYFLPAMKLSLACLLDYSTGVRMGPNQLSILTKILNEDVHTRAQSKKKEGA